MTLMEYIRHYLQPPHILLMLCASIAAISVCLLIIYLTAGSMAKKNPPSMQKSFLRIKNDSLSERFFELIFSSTSILLFVGIYFQIDFFGVGTRNNLIWEKYNSFILLGFILASILLNSLIDNLIIPLQNMEPGERASMRLIGMLYMLFVFAYIKFIYNDNNYDNIILYFLTLVIGRFVYFDASVENFHSAMVEAFRNLPLLILALLCTSLMALVGFSSGYLLRSNGVVLNLFLAHLYLLLVIFVVHHTKMLLRRMEKRRHRSTEKEPSPQKIFDDEDSF